MFVFEDRMGDREILSIFSGENVAQVLLRHNIPPTSVIVLCDNQPVADTHIVNSSATYKASLIEGYDIGSIRNIYKKRLAESALEEVYVKRRLSFTKNGVLKKELASFSLPDLASYVENTIIETCNEFDLVKEDDSVLIGLSGGVDSSSLLIALAQVRKKLPPFRIVAVTFEDYDSQISSTFHHASQLAADFEIEHHIAPSGLAEEIFHLNTPLNEIFPKLMNTQTAHFVMYIDHHTTRRVLEVFAHRQGLNCIALGLHTTDLIAGLINGWMTGYDTGNIPIRRIGDINYIYPLAFIHKRELHLYHYYHTNQFARHSRPNQWEVNPKDRNFYYYLADQFQTYWPALEVMLFTAHNRRIQHQVPLEYIQCQNCGANILLQSSDLVQDECDACTVLREWGFIAE